jgi:hypothetical protein
MAMLQTQRAKGDQGSAGLVPPEASTGTRRPAGLGKIAHFGRQVANVAMGLVLAIGRNKGQSKPGVRVQPRIAAEPNPVPHGSEPGVSTIHWDTGDGSVGEVYVAVDDGEEQLFAKGSKGSKVAEWITAGPVFEFRLVDGPETYRLLASVTVTRYKP